MSSSFANREPRDPYCCGLGRLRPDLVALLRTLLRRWQKPSAANSCPESINFPAISPPSNTTWRDGRPTMLMTPSFRSTSSTRNANISPARGDGNKVALLEPDGTKTREKEVGAKAAQSLYIVGLTLKGRAFGC